MKKSNINKNFSNRKGKEKLYEKTESNNVMDIYAEVTEWKKKESLNEVFDKILDYMVIHDNTSYVLIMEEKQTILALGAGSITKRVYLNGRIERCENVKDIEQYLSRIDEMIERKRTLFLE